MATQALVPVSSSPLETVLLRDDGVSVTAEQIDQIEAMLPAAIEAGALEELNELRRRTEVMKLYQRRRRYQAMANRLAGLQVHTEAAIGLIDLQQNGWPAGNVQGALRPLIVGGERVPEHRRSAWRACGIAMERRLLSGAIEAAYKTDSVSTDAIRRQAYALGFCYVPSSAFTTRLRAELERTGESAERWATSLGRDEINGQTIRAIVRADLKRVRWPIAKVLAESLGLDPFVLPPQPKIRRRVMPNRRLWLRRERKRTGGRWDEAYSRFRRTLDEFSQVAGEGQQWDEAYAHFYAIEQVLANQMKREVIAKGRSR